MKAPNTSSRSTHAGQGRVVQNHNADAISDELAVEAVFVMPTLWELAAQVPPKRLGAPRKLPVVLYCAMLGLSSVWSSFRDAEGQMKGRGHRGRLFWGHVCRMAVEYQRVHRPDDEPFDLEALLATSPLTAQNFFDARRSWLAPFMAELEAIFENVNVAVATEIGYADPNGEGSINNLIRERVATLDGKVVTEVGSRYAMLSNEKVAKTNKGRPARQRITCDSHVVDRTTGEITPVTDMIGENLYHTGDGLKIGHKFIASSIRDDSPNSSVVMTLRVQRTAKEAEEMTDAAIDIKRCLPGLLGVITDAALRGQHNYRLMRAGLIPVNPIAAESVSDDEVRTEKSGLYEVLTHDHPNGYVCRHEIHYYAGGLAEWRPDENGNRTLVDFGTPHVRERKDKGGSRMYAEFRIFCYDGVDERQPASDLGVLRVNVTTKPTGGRNALNIPENIRLVPYTRDTYKRVYGWRNNAENDNRQRDHRKHLARARSRGAERQHWNEMGAAMVQNGIALLLHRQRHDQLDQTAPALTELAA
jgi:hypothetical protein